jgi:hypothetical protein
MPFTMTLRVLPLEPAPALPNTAPSGEPLPPIPTSEPGPALARALGQLATALGELARALGGPATPAGPSPALTTLPAPRNGHHEPPRAPETPDTTIAAAVNELLIAKAGAGRSDAYLRWPRNVARHSWVSYRLAASSSAAETAMEAGHSEVMLFRNYRELVGPEEAARFWGIRARGSDSPAA